MGIKTRIISDQLIPEYSAVIPVMIAGSLNAYYLWEEHWEHWSHMPPLEERTEYPYQNIRSKNFPWGDGDKVSLRHGLPALSADQFANPYPTDHLVSLIHIAQYAYPEGNIHSQSQIFDLEAPLPPNSSNYIHTHGQMRLTFLAAGTPRSTTTTRTRLPKCSAPRSHQYLQRLGFELSMSV